MVLGVKNRLIDTTVWMELKPDLIQLGTPIVFSRWHDQCKMFSVSLDMRW
jgi:hypothetical protein